MFALFAHPWRNVWRGRREFPSSSHPAAGHSSRRAKSYKYVPIPGIKNCGSFLLIISAARLKLAQLSSVFPSLKYAKEIKNHTTGKDILFRGVVYFIPMKCGVPPYNCFRRLGDARSMTMESSLRLVARDKNLYIGSKSWSRELTLTSTECTW